MVTHVQIRSRRRMPRESQLFHPSVPKLERNHLLSHTLSQNMKILLLGEASNLHWTLAEGLRTLGHDVTVASGGSGWMNNRRNIDLRRSGYGLAGSLRYIFDVVRYLPRFRNFDVVQLSNPVFLQLRPEKNRLVFDYLCRHNRKIFLDALGTLSLIHI